MVFDGDPGETGREEVLLDIVEREMQRNTEIIVIKEME